MLKIVAIWKTLSVCELQKLLSHFIPHFIRKDFRILYVPLLTVTGRLAS